MTYSTLVLLFFIAVIIISMLFLVARIIKEKKVEKDVDKGLENMIDDFGDPTVHFDEIDGYSGFIDENNQILKLIERNKLLKKLAKTNDQESYDSLFNNAKNPWGISTELFRMIRVGGVILGLILGLLIAFLFRNISYILFGLFISAIAWFYPMYYYKAIAKEREQEWDKIYEFIWLFKHTSQLYDAQKVCIECKKYIEKNYPQYQEIITGLQDFYDNWDPDKIPDYILKYYNFPIPKELYSILFQMEQTGVSPESNFSNLRVFALNKHDKKVQKALSNVPAKATITTLPFLMGSVITGLMFPMLVTFFTTFGM